MEREGPDVANMMWITLELNEYEQIVVCFCNNNFSCRNYFVETFSSFNV